MNKLLIVAVALVCLCQAPATAAEMEEINAILMHNTYRIEGPSREPGKSTYGTVFLVAEPKGNRLVLVTANHVLEEISGEKATLLVRKQMDKGLYEKQSFDIAIRTNGVPLWTRHPEADVAVMRVSLPKIALETSPSLSTSFLATDAIMEEWEIHPGDELLCLGFPYGATANDMGFAVLRSGKISSFPITPAKTVRTILYDFEVFPGNSGGPVYFSDKGRYYAGNTHIGLEVNCIVETVEKVSDEPQPD